MEFTELAGLLEEWNNETISPANKQRLIEYYLEGNGWARTTNCKPCQYADAKHYIAYQLKLNGFKTIMPDNHKYLFQEGTESLRPFGESVTYSLTGPVNATNKRLNAESGDALVEKYPELLEEGVLTLNPLYDESKAEGTEEEQAAASANPNELPEAGEPKALTKSQKAALAKQAAKTPNAPDTTTATRTTRNRTTTAPAPAATPDAPATTPPAAGTDTGTDGDTLDFGGGTDESVPRGTTPVTGEKTVA